MQRRSIVTLVATTGALLTGCSTRSANPEGPTNLPDTSGVAAGVPAQSLASGFFSTAQAARGQATFREVCTECHSVGDFRGREFEFNWRRRTVWDLYRTMSETMPEDFPGILPATDYADIIAYILQLNRYTSGDIELKATEESMAVIPLGPGADKTGSGATNSHGG